MSRNGDIPGFFRHPKTGKYFRDNPSDVGNPSLQKIKAECEALVPKVPKVKNVIGHLRRSELGLVSGGVAQKEYYEVKTNGKLEIQSPGLLTPVPSLPAYTFESVNFLRGDDTTLYGVWNATNRDGKLHYIVREKDFGSTGHPISYRIPYNIADMWCGYSETDVFVCKLPNYESRIEFISRVTHVGEPVMSFTARDNVVFYCCAGIKRQSITAVGGTNVIKIFRELSHNHDVPVDGRVHALAGHESSGKLLVGINYGAVCIYDLNVQRLGKHLVASNTAINDCLFLDEKEIIIADSNGMLLKIDLRIRDMVAQYTGHKHSLTKRPFSVANDMVCATGSDNVVRLWHISGGDPIHEIRPTKDPQNAMRGWLHMNSNNETLLYCFEDGYENMYQC